MKICILLLMLSSTAQAHEATIYCKSIEYVGVRTELQIRGDEARWRKLVDGKAVLRGNTKITEGTANSISGNGFLLEVKSDNCATGDNASLVAPLFGSSDSYLNSLCCTSE